MATGKTSGYRYNDESRDNPEPSDLSFFLWKKVVEGAETIRLWGLLWRDTVNLKIESSPTREGVYRPRAINSNDMRSKCLIERGSNGFTCRRNGA